MADDTWYQQALTPPRVLEINLRIGVIPEEDHAQVLLELKDPTNGILIAQHSIPHCTIRDVFGHIGRAKAKACLWIEAETNPF